MAFTEDLSVFFDQADFAVEAVFSRGGNEVACASVIFDIPTEYVGFEQVNVAADAPYCLARTSDVSGVKRADSVVIEDVTYKVALIKHDGTGVTRIDLELY